MPDENVSVIKAKTERLKLWIGLTTLIVTNIATLITAVMANYKEEKEEVAKASYSELSNAISKISQENVDLYKDISNLRGYLAGLSDHGMFRAPIKEEPQKPKPTETKPRPKPAPKPVAIDTTPPPIAATKPVRYRPPNIGQLKK